MRVNHKTELEKAFEERYNETIMAATGEVDEMKNIIYHVCNDFGLESAQVLFGDGMYKRVVLCPNDLCTAAIKVEVLGDDAGQTDEVDTNQLS